MYLDAHAPRWVNARYLTYTVGSLAGFLDVETAKINDALGKDGESVYFTNDFRFAVTDDGGGAKVATVLDGGGQ